MKRKEKIKRDKMKRYLFECLNSYHGNKNISELRGILLYEKCFGTYTPVVSDEPILEYTIIDPAEVFYRGYEKIFSIIYSVGGSFEIVKSTHDKYTAITHIIIKTK